MNEHDLYSSIQDMLNLKLGNQRSGIFIEVKDRDVKIRGIVDTSDEKQEIERLVKDIEGVGKIINNLIIAIGIPDEQIAKDILYDIEESGKDIDDLDIYIDSGRVILHGVLNNMEEKGSILNSIRSVSGVVSIEDNINISH